MSGPTTPEVDEGELDYKEAVVAYKRRLVTGALVKTAHSGFVQPGGYEFVWRGEVWPGQPLEWHLRHETEHAQDQSAAMPGDEADAGWESKLKLTLPQLGTVTAPVTGSGGCPAWIARVEKPRSFQSPFTVRNPPEFGRARPRGAGKPGV